VLVARGAHRDAIAEHGLRIEWPEDSVTLPMPVVGHPSELTFGDGDVVLVAVKSQDTAGVVDALAATAPPATPIACLQNGVANEPAFLRRFERVYGVPVMAPTSHLRPGVVQAHTRRAAAIFDVGRWPAGVDPTASAVSDAFRASGFESVARPDIARWKYSKLLMNLGNPVDALCPRDDDARRLVTMAREEGEQVLAAAGIDYVSEEEDRARRGDLLRMAPIDGQRREGGSTWQSLVRGLPVEVDFLNGEVVLQGRLHDVPTPVNTALQHTTHHAVATRTPPNSIPAAAILTTLGITERSSDD
jgi:2-dehydropantoate 2-reductase